MIYILMPFIAWCVAGCVKFAINYIRFGKKAKSLIGYGGFPSTHTTIMSSVVFLAGFKEGFATPLFSLGLGALLILVIDAHGLRRKVGEQARLINELQKQKENQETYIANSGLYCFNIIIRINVFKINNNINFM